MQIRSVGIDLGKTTFHLVALGDNGKVLLKKKFTQKQLIALVLVQTLRWLEWTVIMVQDESIGFVQGTTF
ncbi:hypothetical protein BDD14_0019 [Edaphobacter modestus]|uniref:Uncharacterized protein n=1 Tax=Edaphobacter modestus TaxID=388466 RepID=A0A4Q7YN20_9BACT|nr:IS110 family transposase [Edaphobacter modestus]RZU38748.1 hypothetical protein BDD14_0019 [Edaphobacter modestus]